MYRLLQYLIVRFGTRVVVVVVVVTLRIVAVKSQIDCAKSLHPHNDVFSVYLSLF